MRTLMIQGWVKSLQYFRSRSSRRCALLYSFCDLKVAQMSEQRCLFRKFKLYVFELRHKAVEVNENICSTKGESAIDHGIETRRFKKLRKLEDQAKSGWPKTVDSLAVLSSYLVIRVVIVTIVRNGHGDPSSIPEQGSLHFT